jgi:hypothetical protein
VPQFQKVRESFNSKKCVSENFSGRDIQVEIYRCPLPTLKKCVSENFSGRDIQVEI